MRVCPSQVGLTMKELNTIPEVNIVLSLTAELKICVIFLRYDHRIRVGFQEDSVVLFTGSVQIEINLHIDY